MFGAMQCRKSRFNLFGLLTNSTQRICLVARGGREPVRLRSQSPTLSLCTTHVDTLNYMWLVCMLEDMFNYRIKHKFVIIFNRAPINQ